MPALAGKSRGCGRSDRHLDRMSVSGVASPRFGYLESVCLLPIPSARSGRDRRGAADPPLGNTQDTPWNDAGYGVWRDPHGRAETSRGLRFVATARLSTLRAFRGGARSRRHAAQFHHTPITDGSKRIGFEYRGRVCRTQESASARLGSGWRQGQPASDCCAGPLCRRLSLMVAHMSVAQRHPWILVAPASARPPAGECLAGLPDSRRSVEGHAGARLRCRRAFSRRTRA